jgi:hypothetical protein
LEPEKRITVCGIWRAFNGLHRFFPELPMPAGSSSRPKTATIVPFPLDRRHQIKACPHCGTHSDVWKIGRLLWGYCDVHELRWVVADYKTATPQSFDRQHIRRGLEFLSAFVEISR